MMKSMMKKTNNFLTSFKATKNLLQNKYVLYFIFILALVQLLFFLSSNDFYFVAIFILIGFLTSFFSKNMIVVLSVTLAFTNIIKYGATAGNREGFKEGEGEEKDDSNKKSATKSSPEATEVVTKEPVTKEPVTTEKETKGKDMKKETKEVMDTSLALNNGKTEEQFTKNSNVYTHPEDMDYDEKSDKMILAQEKMLKSMNQYKPLLDTINSLAKNMAAFKK